MQNEIDFSSLEIDWEQLAQDYTKSCQSQRVSEKRVFYQTSPSGYPKIPTSILIRDYQQNAILSWFQNKGRGTLKMATGSGYLLQNN
jgi:superfamily II DNA or RNA helicase